MRDQRSHALYRKHGCEHNRRASREFSFALRSLTPPNGLLTLSSLWVVVQSALFLETLFEWHFDEPLLPSDTVHVQACCGPPSPLAPPGGPGEEALILFVSSLFWACLALILGVFRFFGPLTGILVALRRRAKATDHSKCLNFAFTLCPLGSLWAHQVHWLTGPAGPQAHKGP